MEYKKEGFFRRYLRRRRERILEQNRAYVRKKIERATFEGEDYFFLSVHTVLSVEMWMELQTDYDIEEVGDGWNVYF